MSNWSLKLSDRIKGGLGRLTGLRPASELPSLVWDLHTVCNLNCPYWLARAERSNSFGPIAEPSYIAKFQYFFRKWGPFNVQLTGGEPLLTPRLAAMVEFLVANGHTVSMTTNLSLDTDQLTRCLPPSRTGFLMATLHYDDLPDVDKFMGRLKALCQSGYPMIAKLLLEPPVWPRLETLYSALHNTGAAVYPIAKYTTRPDQSWRPQELSRDQIERLLPMIPLKSIWLMFEGGFRCKGTTCRAGSKAFYARAWSGEVAGCGHSFPRHLGDLYQKRFQPLSEPVTCGLEQCACSFNYRNKLIEGLEDAADFWAFVGGRTRAMPYGEYKAWLQAAGVEACWPQSNAPTKSSPSS